MLPKSNRLNLKKDFKWVVCGKRSETKHFKLFYQIGVNSHPLVGIALSKSVFRKATKRNRARRLTAVAIQANYDKLLNNLNLVIMPKIEILQTRPEQLSEELYEIKNLY